MVMKKIVLLSRKSFLAKIQTHIAEIEINKIQKNIIDTHYSSSVGDTDMSAKAWEQHGFGIFTNSLSKKLILKDADVIVHSFKDLPVKNLNKTSFICLKRDDPRDVILIKKTSLNKKKLVFKNIFQANPPIDSGYHFGSRLAIKDNYIYASAGERGQGMIAQDASKHPGSIIRVHLDGSIPNDNPKFEGKSDWLPEIYQIGIRNPQGMVLSEAIGLERLKKEKTMDGKYLDGVEKIILEFQLVQNGNLVLQKPFSIGCHQLLQVQ